MRIQSIRATIEIRDPARDRFLGAPGQMTLGKMHRIAELHHIAEEIGPVAEALQNAGHLLSTRLLPPLIVDGGDFARRVCVFNQPNLCLGIFHRPRHDNNREYSTEYFQPKPRFGLSGAELEAMRRSDAKERCDDLPASA
jgi:hypothetical protein